jgi:hypothetical protein
MNPRIRGIATAINGLISCSRLDELRKIKGLNTTELIAITVLFYFDFFDFLSIITPAIPSIRGMNLPKKNAPPLSKVGGLINKDGVPNTPSTIRIIANIFMIDLGL